MLNLLIAIISEVFQKVNSNYILANYQEKARIIAENCYLIPGYRKRGNGTKNEYLITAREITEGEEINSVDIAERVKEIHKYITTVVDEEMKLMVSFPSIIHV